VKVMTIWEKIAVNLEKGVSRTKAGAALFSERVRAELNLVRLRIKLEGVRTALKEQYGLIGRRIVDLQKSDTLPANVDSLLRDEEITAALAEIIRRERDLEDIRTEIANEQAVLRPVEKPGDTIA
jgi:hypothetical protein